MTQNGNKLEKIATIIADSFLMSDHSEKPPSNREEESYNKPKFEFSNNLIYTLNFNRLKNRVKQIVDSRMGEHTSNTSSEIGANGELYEPQEKEHIRAYYQNGNEASKLSQIQSYIEHRFLTQQNQGGGKKRSRKSKKSNKKNKKRTSKRKRKRSRTMKKKNHKK